ncbi:MAG TPA: class I SAM-dependent methyltransferase, partial [Thermoanaerobaculia bacterium]
MADERFVDGPPAGADAWRDVWRDDRRFPPRPSRHEWLLGFLRRLFRRASEPDADRQKNYNLVLLDLVDGLRRDNALLRADLRADIEKVQTDVRNADEEIAREVARLRDLIPVSAKRNDALIAALDQKIETVAVRLRDLTNPLVAAAPQHASSPDFLYRRLEDSLRGSEATVRESVAAYVERAKDHQPLLDVGCGRGELLAACRDAGIAARGFDTNERSVADLVARGFDATLAGVPECFASLASESVGSVVAMHVVEHLPVDLLFALFREAARVLRRGGLLMLETPNAESLLVTGTEFWRDPTHLAPRHPAALTLLAREHGFEIDEVRAIHPFADATRIAMHDDDPHALRRV